MFPRLLINLEKIKLNTAFIKQLAPHLLLAGVTKGCGGDIKVGQAMLAGGATQLADSRLLRLRCLRQYFPQTPLLMLRQPLQDEVAEAVKLNLTVVVSTHAAAAALAEAAAKQNNPLSLMLMLEVGSLRDGLLPSEAIDLAVNLQKKSNLKISGVAANVGCHQGKMPDTTVFKTIKKVVCDLEKKGCHLKYVSGGNSSLISYLTTKSLPRYINHVRIGEAILLGVDTLNNKPVTGLATDAFIVEAEIIESKKKNHYYNQVIGLGRQEIGFGSLKPLIPGEITNITSDHLVMRTKHALAATSNTVKFYPNYFALMSLTESRYVKKKYIEADGTFVTLSG